MDIGKRIRQLRVQNGLTQEELASRCELTKGFVSQLENNLATPSLPALMDLVEALGTDMSTFFSKEKEFKLVFHQNDFFEDSRENAQILWVVPNAQKNKMEPILLKINPHHSSQVIAPHDGEEFGFVLSGVVSLVYGSRTEKVRRGETFYIKGDHEHYLRNDSASPSQVLWITTPPSF